MPRLGLQTSRMQEGHPELENFALQIAEAMTASIEQVIMAFCRQSSPGGCQAGAPSNGLTSLKILTSAQDTSEQRQVFGLLWNRATVLFQQHNFERARELYAGALTFAPSGLKAKTARTLAMCCLGIADFDR